MSIKKLFDQKNQKNKLIQNLKISNKTLGDLIDNSEIESENQLDSHADEINRYVPDIDYSDPSKFARFGFASEYYKNSIKFIYGTYPYDGSLFEREAWHNSASFLDNWIFEHKYPRTTGYAVISPSSRANTFVTGGYGSPSIKEYLYLQGGPHKDTKADKFSDAWPQLYDVRREGGSANLYNTSSNRDNNLNFDLRTSGATVEFWMKKRQDSNIQTKEVVFDLWNNTTSISAGHGRLRVELTASGTPFLVTALSGTAGALRAPIGSTLTYANVADNAWHHYAFTFNNDTTNIEFELYRDGKRIETVTTGAILNPVTGAMQAAIGSLVTTTTDPALSGTPNMLGYGKLSASLDEFRYWKTRRNSKQLGQNWFSQVGGGTNTDTANTTLGVYYKFNEGITTSGSLDRIALDYSGRTTNASWTGYSTLSRNTGSAIDDAGYREFKDPIVRSSHPDINNLSKALRASGSAWDTNNNSNFNRLIPSWLLDDNLHPGYDNLMGLIQITSYYLDNLSVVIDQMPSIKSVNYVSASANRLFSKPNVYANRLLRDGGFQFDELFTEASAIEELYDKNPDIQLKEKVHRIKNLIYTNIYNNLNNLYKTKGTFKSIRHLLHCIGIGEDIIKTNLYADNLTYKIQDNFRISEDKSKLVDFNHSNRFDATIYQYPISSDSQTVSFISASNDKQMEGLGYTYEGEFVFPRKPDRSEAYFSSYDYGYITSSLFGVHTAQTTSTTDTTWATVDTSNFQVYAVRPQGYSEHAAFVLTSSDSSPIPVLTSKTFKDVYDNSKWNFAVKISPTKKPWATMIPGTSASDGSNTYTVDFYGVNYIGDQLSNEFHVSGTITRAQATGSLGAPRRVYVGAHYQDFTSSVLQYTDVRVNNFKTWAKPLSNEEIKYHAKFNKNIGTIDAYQNTALFNSSLQGTSVPSISTLLFNWDFSNLTGSDASGQFTVFDTTSGSISSYNRYNWLSNIVDKNYSARADFFPASSTDVIDIDYLTNYKQELPDIISSNDMVKVMTSDDSRPINYFFSIEKNMYQAISEEMLQYFATAKDFNNLYGEPVNRYRQRYKQVEKLRQLFFERIGNTADLEKFISYYKWFDDAVSTMIQNFIPASARNSEDINTVIESHILERNKYWNKFPTLESKIPNPSSALKGIEELTYNWKEGHAPVLPRPAVNENQNCLWWHDRAERTKSANSSGDSNVDSNRDDLLNVITTEVTGSTYVQRALSRPYKFVVDRLNQISPTSDKYENKKKHFYKPILRFGAQGNLVISSSLLQANQACNVTGSLPTKKHKWDFKVENSLESANSYTSGKGNMFTPFVLYSSSLGTGYQSQLSSFGSTSIEASRVAINNMHQDTYENMPAPMQGPFTERWVGGSQHRHVRTNFYDANRSRTGLDDSVTRPEAFSISISSNQLTLRGPDNISIHNQRAPYFRDEVAKRPLNIKNIKMTSSSPTVIGNYEKRREYFQTSGRDINNLWWVSGSDGTGGFNQTTSEQLAVSGTINFEVPNRGILENGQRNETVFVERFSAPGGPETMGQGFLDIYSAQYSVYNALPFRNLTVRKQLNKLLTNHMTNNADGQIVGYDAILSPSPFSITTATASFHGYASNVGYYPLERSDGTLGLKKIYNNGHVKWQIGYNESVNSFIKKSVLSQHPGASIPLDFVATPDGTYISGSDFNADVIVFLSQSQYGVFVDPQGNRVFGLDENLSSSAERTYTDFAGLNTNIYEPITSVKDPATGTTRTYLGYVNSSDSYRPNAIGWGHTITPGRYAGGMVDRWTTASFGLDNRADANLLNSIILNRQGPYGWPTWKQIRGGSHPIIREFNKRNELSINFGSAGSAGTKEQDVRNYIFSPVSRTKASSAELRMRLNDRGDTTLKTYNLPLQNSNITFDDAKLRNRLGIPKVLLDNEGKRNQPYDKIRKLYKNESVPVAASPVDEFINLTYSDVVYPKRTAAFLSGTHYREAFSVEYWKNDRSERNKENAANSFGFTIPSQSVWLLDGRNPGFRGFYMSTANPATRPTGSLGELLNQYSIYHMGNKNALTGATLYSRPIEEELKAATAGSSPTPAERVVAGDAFWEAGSQSGKDLSGPFYESYDEYAEALKVVGKGYSLIPEFRISEHMDFYINDKYGDFLSDNPGFLTITGSTARDSSISAFGKVYTTSDFLQMFSVVRRDHEGFARASELTLECKALKKFLPYDGFYPAQRTKQLSQLFSQSYGNTIVYSGSNPSYRTMATPLFAPGILHNSIKSALAVDYPIYTGSYSYSFSNTNTQVPYNQEDYQKRLPFETLVDPEFYLAGVNIADAEPHPSASINSTASLPGAGSATYRLAMHNFLAEVPSFFLKDSGLTTFASNDDRNSYVVETYDGSSPKEYKMRIVVSHAKFRTRKQISDLFDSQGTSFQQRSTASWEFNPPTLDIYRRFSSDPSQKIATGQYYGSQIPFQNMRHGSSFGPPTRAAQTFFCGTRNGAGFSSNGSIEYTPFTPPYYDGYSEIEFTFKPTHEGEYDLNELLGQTTHEVRRYPTGQRTLETKGDIIPDTYDVCTRNMMQLTSSLNFLQKANVKDVQTDAAGNPRQISDPNAAVLQWVIQPKWEAPVLDFSGSSVTLPSYATGSVPLGLWHQYGSVPTNSNAGLFMSLQDPQREELNIPERTGSLADLVGFKKGETKLGQVAPRKDIYEAVVAVPFTVKTNGKMQFYSIDRSTIDLLTGKISADQVPVGQIKNPGKTTTEMVTKMQRYVMPPKFDFITNKEMQPFAMYLFEFKHTFNQKDLTDIWQNLPPDSLLNISEPESLTSIASISHPLLIDEFYGITPSPSNKKTIIDSKTQWFVFKVKQRANKNYYAMTADSKDDARFKFSFNVGSAETGKESVPDYSYNWPYDFFSMVELAQMNASVKLTKGEDPIYEDSLVEEREEPIRKSRAARKKTPTNAPQPRIENKVTPRMKAQERSVKKDLFDGKEQGITPPLNVKR